MIISGMQPYLFPYIGYFQLINASDIFILVDDVQYIQRGWINRNRILINGNDYLFTFPVSRKRINYNINNIYFDSINQHKKKFITKIEFSYKKAKYFDAVFPWLLDTINIDETNISRFNNHLIARICQYLSIDTPILIESEIDYDNTLKGHHRVLAILKLMNADQCINSIGGIHLYDKETFAKHGVRLSFIKPKKIVYRQFDNDFVENLSIIDVLMFNSPEKIKFFLNEYNLV